jgi:hypothetical protein
VLIWLPALLQAAWFFHPSEENYQSLREDLPTNGMLAATFRSRLAPPALLLLGGTGWGGCWYDRTA